ncbi:DUF916 domain-containing protein [Natronosporangium hydrolyticum]|uniref:DUF916 domain-containing protein n=1 Tax=Natronosporangium hydrolyticum TaxID=2811111 RepID=A0A895YFN7_9ACTN|nr:DUF916 domain-containing protein [Natronosporangium hydrolyticum]QSB14279.1 DUF916 domain-containing protein [Natronosporangium hydrolyticum]
MPSSPLVRRAPRIALAALIALLAAPPDLTPAAASPAAAAPTAVAPAGAVPASQQSLPDDPEIRWAVQPTREAGPTGRSWFTYDLVPGGELVDSATITNFSSTTLDFEVYPTDAYTTPDGGFALLPADEPASGLATWVGMAQGRYRVPAGETLEVEFRLRVPANATPGDHAGGIVASLTSRTNDADGQLVDLDRRVAARVYVRVAGPAEPAVQVESVQVSYDNPIAPWGEHRMTVTYVLRNTGNLRVGGDSQVRVTGPFRWRLATSGQTELPELLPGSTLTVTETVTGLAPVLRLTAAIEVDAVSSDGPMPQVRRTTGVWAIPWLLVAVLLVGGAVVAVRRIRRRRAAAQRPGAAGRPSS